MLKLYLIIFKFYKNVEFFKFTFEEIKILAKLCKRMKLNIKIH